MHAAFMVFCLPMLEDLMSTHRCNSTREQQVSALLCRAVQIPQGGVLTRRQSAALAAAQGDQGEADAKVQDRFHPALPAVAAC